MTLKHYRLREMIYFFYSGEREEERENQRPDRLIILNPSIEVLWFYFAFFELHVCVK